MKTMVHVTNSDKTNVTLKHQPYRVYIQLGQWNHLGLITELLILNVRNRQTLLCIFYNLQCKQVH